MTAKSKNTHKGGRENRLPFFHSCGERFARRGYFFTVRRPGSGGHWGGGGGIMSGVNTGWRRFYEEGAAGVFRRSGELGGAFRHICCGGAAHAHRERVVHPRNIRGGLPGGLALPGLKGEDGVHTRLRGAAARHEEGRRERRRDAPLPAAGRGAPAGAARAYAEAAL